MDVDQLLKRSRQDGPDDSTDNGNGEAKKARVELTDTASQIEKYVDNAEEADAPETYDEAFLKNLLVKFETAVSTNLEHREKYANDPLKFYDSEYALVQVINSLSLISEQPDLYEALANSGSLGTIVSLLGHDNEQICEKMVQVLIDLTDDDVDGDEVDLLQQELIKADVVAGLAELLYRVEDDNAFVEKVLTLFERLVDEGAERIITNQRAIEFLLKMLANDQIRFQQSRQSAAYIICTVCQTASMLIRELGSKAVETLLEQVNALRSAKTLDFQTKEIAGSILDALAAIARNVAGKQLFLEAEGVELMLLLLDKSCNKWFKPRALTVLVAAVRGYAAGEACQRVVNSGGLSKLIKTSGPSPEELDSYLWIQLSLLRWLDLDSEERFRTIHKYNEKKVHDLVTLRSEKKAALDNVTNRISEERAALRTQMEEDELLKVTKEFEWDRDQSIFLETIQVIDAIFAWLMLSDLSDLAKSVIEKDEVLSTLRQQLEDIRTNRNDDSDGAGQNSLQGYVEQEFQKDTIAYAEMLDALIAALGEA